jgi:hypothetical protein
MSPSWQRPLSYSRISAKWILIFMTAYTRAYHLFLTWARWIQSPLTYFVFQIFIYYFNIYIKLLVKDYEMSRAKFYWAVFCYNTQVCAHIIPSVGGKQSLIVHKYFHEFKSNLSHIATVTDIIITALVIFLLPFFLSQSILYLCSSSLQPQVRFMPVRLGNPICI